ncbi:MAG: peptidylprolyl isomerase [Candidatus Auribacterota bacterium]
MRCKTILLCITLFAIINWKGNVALAQTDNEGEPLMIEKGNVVKVDYTLTVDGEVIDSSKGNDPLEVTVGSGQVITGFDNALIGMKLNEKKSVQIAPEEAYGPVNDQAFTDVPKDMLPPHITPEVGMLLSVGSPDGRSQQARISEIKEDVIVLDFNHPLAGKALNFDIEVVEIEK